MRHVSSFAGLSLVRSNLPRDRRPGWRSPVFSRSKQVAGTCSTPLQLRPDSCPTPCPLSSFAGRQKQLQRSEALLAAAPGNPPLKLRGKYRYQHANWSLAPDSSQSRRMQHWVPRT